MIDAGVRMRLAGIGVAAIAAFAVTACGDKRDAGVGDSIRVAGGALDVPPDTSALRETPGTLPVPGAAVGVTRQSLPPDYYSPPPIYTPPPVPAYTPPAYETIPSYNEQQAREPARSLPQARTPDTAERAVRIATPAESLRVAPAPTTGASSRPRPDSARLQSPARPVAPDPTRPALPTPPRDTAPRTDTTGTPR